MIEIVYIRYLFREEAQKVVYFRQLIPDKYIVSTTPLVFNKEDFSSYEDDAKLLDSELRDVVYYNLTTKILKNEYQKAFQIAEG